MPDDLTDPVSHSQGLPGDVRRADSGIFPPHCQGQGDAPGTRAHIQDREAFRRALGEHRFRQDLRVLPRDEDVFIHLKFQAHKGRGSQDMLERHAAGPLREHPHIAVHALFQAVLPDRPVLFHEIVDPVCGKCLRHQVPGIQLRLRHAGPGEHACPFPEELPPGRAGLFRPADRHTAFGISASVPAPVSSGVFVPVPAPVSSGITVSGKFSRR